MFTSQAFAETEQDRKVIEELENMQNTIFSAPVTPLTEVDYSVKSVPETRIGRINPRKNVTPMFKRVRIKIQNYYRTKAYEEAQQLIEEERKEAERLQKEEENYEREIKEMTLRQFKQVEEKPADNQEIKEEKKIFNFFKRNKAKQVETSQEEVKSEEVASE